MNTGNAVMTGNIIMLAIIALIVVAGLAASLIAIALQSIKSVDGKSPHSPASWPESPVDVLQRRKRRNPRWIRRGAGGPAGVIGGPVPTDGELDGDAGGRASAAGGPADGRR